MRNNRFMIGMLVLCLVVSAFGTIAMAKKPGNSDSASDTVTWNVQGYVELTIDDSAFDFGQIDAGLDTFTATNANTLYVTSNTDWSLTFSVTGDGSSHLGVALSANKGTNDAQVSVDYSLNNLRSMDPGSYTAIVTYTVTAK